MFNFEQCRLFDGEDGATCHIDNLESAHITSRRSDYPERKFSDAAIDQGWGWRQTITQNGMEITSDVAGDDIVDGWTPPISEELARVKAMISSARECLREKKFRQL